MATKYAVRAVWGIIIAAYILIAVLLVKSLLASDYSKALVKDTTHIEKSMTVLICFEDCYLVNYDHFQIWAKRNDLTPRPEPTPWVLPTPVD